MDKFIRVFISGRMFSRDKAYRKVNVVEAGDIHDFTKTKTI